VKDTQDAMHAKIPATALFYFNGTFLDRSNGAHARAASLLAFLQQRYQRVILYSYRNHATCPWRDELVEQFKSAHPSVALVLDESSRLTRLVTRLKNLLVTLFPARTASILRFNIPAAARKYRRLVSTQADLVLFVNYVDGLTQLNGLESRSAVIDTHDVKFAGYNKRWNKRATTLPSLRKFRSEVALLDTVKAVIAISPTEAGFYRMVLTQPEVFYIPQFDVVEPVQESAADAHGGFDYDLVFVGSDNPLNVRGIMDFCRREEAWLSRYRMAVCGNVCDQPEVAQYAARHPHIRLLGFVPDMAAIYKTSKAALSPVNGTGLKIKIVDALQHGKPVFASRQSLDGLPAGYEQSIFPIEQDAIEQLILHAGVRRAAETEARRYFRYLQQAGDRQRFAAFLAESACT
jgi:Glycosyl transferases group 1